MGRHRAFDIDMAEIESRVAAVHAKPIGEYPRIAALVPIDARADKGKPGQPSGARRRRRRHYRGIEPTRGTEQDRRIAAGPGTDAIRNGLAKTGRELVEVGA